MEKQILNKMFAAVVALFVVSFSMPVQAKDDNLLFYDDFEYEDLSTRWTLHDVDGDGRQWGIFILEEGLKFYVAFGNNAAVSWSWSNVSFVADHYMISPEVEGAATLTYYVSTNNTYPDYYEVLASSATNAIGDFTRVYFETPTGPTPYGTGQTEWAMRTVELPAGTRYVAFRHKCEDMNYIFIDEVKIYSSPTTAIESVKNGVAQQKQGIYNLQGQKMNVEFLHLPAGVYMVTSVRDKKSLKLLAKKLVV